MAIKEDNKRITITLDKDTIDKLEYLTKFFEMSKTKLINKLINHTYKSISPF